MKTELHKQRNIGSPACNEAVLRNGLGVDTFRSFLFIETIYKKKKGISNLPLEKKI